MDCVTPPQRTWSWVNCDVEESDSSCQTCECGINSAMKKMLAVTNQITTMRTYPQKSWSRLRDSHIKVRKQSRSSLFVLKNELGPKRMLFLPLAKFSIVDKTNLKARANPKFPCLIKLVMNSVNFSRRLLFKKSTWFKSNILGIHAPWFLLMLVKQISINIQQRSW